MAKKHKKNQKKKRGEKNTKKTAKTKKHATTKKQKKTEPRQEPKTLTKGGKTIRIYGHEVDKNKITNASLEAYHKKRYTTNDIQPQEYIQNPGFHNLMIKIAILDRIEEELIRIYPDAEIERVNAVTIRVR